MANTQGQEGISSKGKERVGNEGPTSTQSGRADRNSQQYNPPPSGPPELIMLREWIRENQTVALAGAFAVGSLIGYLMKK